MNGLTPLTLLRTLALGLYVLGGELHWVCHKGLAHLLRRQDGNEHLAAWRQAQIDRRKQCFALD